MKAVDYLKEKARMSEKCSGGTCDECLLSNKNNEKGVYCDELEEGYPEIAVKIVEKWAKENPVKTYLSVFLEKFPNTSLRKDGTPRLCPMNVFKTADNCTPIDCKDCWNREYKEEK